MSSATNFGALRVNSLNTFFSMSIYMLDNNNNNTNNNNNNNNNNTDNKNNYYYCYNNNNNNNNSKLTKIIDLIFHVKYQVFFSGANKKNTNLLLPTNCVNNILMEKEVAIILKLLEAYLRYNHNTFI